MSQGINWNRISAITDVFNKSLCHGEEKTLTETEVHLINEALVKIAQEASFIEEKFNAARERFRSKSN